MNFTFLAKYWHLTRASWLLPYHFLRNDKEVPNHIQFYIFTRHRLSYSPLFFLGMYAMYPNTYSSSDLSRCKGLSVCCCAADKLDCWAIISWRSSEKNLLNRFTGSEMASLFSPRSLTSHVERVGVAFQPWTLSSPCLECLVENGAGTQETSCWLVI